MNPGVFVVVVDFVFSVQEFWASLGNITKRKVEDWEFGITIGNSGFWRKLSSTVLNTEWKRTLEHSPLPLS